MKRTLFVGILCLISLCAGAGVLEDIVPRPAQAELRKGTLRVSGIVVKCDPTFEPDARNAVSSFASHLGFVSGKSCPFSTPIGLHEAVASGKVKGMLFLKDASYGPEAYGIVVESDKAIIRAGGLPGVLYALQTLQQMLPAAIYGKLPAEKEHWRLPCCEIRDEPRFAWRGMHLDCSSHFWQVAEIKRYLDVMAMYKLNRFVWQLSDDQGWRIEINAYPLLSQISCWREGDDASDEPYKRYGGFYSQDEVRDVVAYAARRGITVVPEIEFPGHMLAAMAAYPELGCAGGPYAVSTSWVASDQTLCAGKESTFDFLKAVFSEVAELFPGECIYLSGGGSATADCPDCQARIQELGLADDPLAAQRLQERLTARVSDFLATRGKRFVGPDQISSPAPLRDFGGTVYLDDIYNADPQKGLTPEQAQQLQGVLAFLPTPFVTTDRDLEYKLLPRLLALAELQWSPAGQRSFEEFSRVLREHESPVLKQAGYSYSDSDFLTEGSEESSTDR